MIGEHGGVESVLDGDRCSAAAKAVLDLSEAVAEVAPPVLKLSWRSLKDKLNERSSCEEQQCFWWMISNEMQEV